MKNTFKYYAGMLLIGVTLANISCSSDEDGITPAEITNLTAESTSGRIVLRWDTPEDAGIRYIEVNYYDPLQKKDVMRTASIYADSIEIPDTRKKFGEYQFSVQTVSPTGDKSAVQTISKVSEPALPTFVSTQIALTAADLSTNAQEPTEGPIANLLDGNTGTFFHTAWSVNIPAPHWMQVNLKEEITGSYKFYYAPRNNGNNKPTDFDLMGSTDGTNWFLIRNFTKDADGLPVTSTCTFTSEIYDAPQPFSQIRMVVNATNTSSIFWTMSEFKFYSVSVTDPEAADE